MASGTDMWHPSSTDTWHSFQVILDMLSTYFQVTHVTSLSTTYQHGDVQASTSDHPPRDVIVQCQK
jgi:hypothetical protein